jgi:hypothetical protein
MALHLLMLVVKEDVGDFWSQQPFDLTCRTLMAHMLATVIFAF